MYIVESNNAGDYLKERSLLFPTGTTAWSQKQIIFVTLPATTSVYIVAKIENGYGTFNVDDLSLT